MMRTLTTKFLLITIFLTIFAKNINRQSAFIPLTGDLDFASPILLIKAQPDPIIKDGNEGFDSTKNEKNDSNSSILNFKNSLVDGKADVIKGIFVKNNFAFKVFQQPSGQVSFVSTIENVVTEFSIPKKYGVTGLLAHNYLAGTDFYSLNIDDLVQIIYGDGDIQSYKVTQILAFQALQPNSTQSQFLNLATGQKLSATQMFKLVYTGNHHLTLQTCIQQGEIDTWGRLFIIGEPV